MTTVRAAGSAPSTRAARITEIDGLRGISLTLVVLFHLFGQGRVSGGVDVFLMISGFLLTLSLARSLERHRPLGIVARWGRTFLRLAPPAAVVLLAIVVASFTVFDPRTQLETLREVVAAALYVENWQMMSAQLAYGAAGPGTSSLQHFWSLSVQAQFFIVLPLIAWATLRAAPRARVRAFWTVLVIATAASFAYAVVQNGSDPTATYFDSFARAWELGAGGLAAGLWMRGIVVPERWRGVAGWAGVAGVAMCGFLIDGATAYPGPLALVPVGAAMLVLLSSGAPGRLSASRLLSRPLLVRLDSVSYGLYLWHWPILIVFLTVRGRDDGAIGPVGAAAVLVASFVATMLTTWLLRIPLRRAATRGSVGQVLAVVIAIAVGAAPAAAAHQALASGDDAALTECSGAAALDPQRPECADFTVHDTWAPPSGIVPGEATRMDDEATRAECWGANRRDEHRLCALGDPSGDTRILALGDSHLAMLIDALDEIGRERGWRIELASRGHCRWIDDVVKDVGTSDLERERCTNWRQRTSQLVRAGEYDVLLTTSASHTRFEVPEGVDPRRFETENLLKAWGERPDPVSTPVIAIRDNPRVLSSVQRACLGDTRALVSGDCAMPRDEAIAQTGVDAAVRQDPNARMVDVNDYICGPETCSPVVGGVYVYRDNAHLTRTFVRTLTPYLDRALTRVID